MFLSLVAVPKLYFCNYCIMDPSVVTVKMISASPIAVSVPIRMVMLLPEHSLTRSLWSSWQGLMVQLFPELTYSCMTTSDKVLSMHMDLPC